MLSTDSALVAMPMAVLGDALRQSARDLSLPLVETDGALALDVGFGKLRAAAEAGGTRVQLEAPTDAELQTLRDTVAARLDALAPRGAVNWAGHRASRSTTGALPANVTVLQVGGVRRISPSFYRLRLTGDVTRFADPANGLHFRFLFGPEGHLAPVLDADGVTRWPGGAAAWHRPAYTLRAIDADAGWLDADVFIHQGGRASGWCATVTPGTSIAISGPGGGGAVRRHGWGWSATRPPCR